jgi:hypothetical protein
MLDKVRIKIIWSNVALRATSESINSCDSSLDEKE